MVDPALVGNEYWSETVVVEAGAIARYAAAIGDGSLTRRGRVEAAPGFLLALVPFEALARRIGDGRQIHGSEFQIEQMRPVAAGDRLSVRSRIVDVARRGGVVSATEVVTVDDEGRDASTGEVVYRARRVYAVVGAREAP